MGDLMRNNAKALFLGIGFILILAILLGGL
jgi:hypothetical protein